MTEIFGTLGPACAQPDLLEKMFVEGMTGMRLNTSHSGLKESELLIGSFHQAAQRAGIKPELLIDMQGPEVRIGDLPAPLALKESGETVLMPQTEMAWMLQTESVRMSQTESARMLQTESAQMSQTESVRMLQTESARMSQTESAQMLQAESLDVSVIPVPDHVSDALDTVIEAGDRILLDDGRMELAVTSVRPKIVLRVLRGGLLQKRKSLKIVDKMIPGPAVTDQDIENIRLAKEYGVTVLMQPFVTEAKQLLEVKSILQKHDLEHVRIFAKIENREGMEHIRDILPYADMIVIARGDLGNDMPLWKLPAAQKNLSEICKREKKPFLVVTQLLDSMVHNPYPTRAEVSDIFHAVTDGAAAVMVTNETAAGRYPAEVIRYLKKTVQEAEAWMKHGGCT